MRSWMCVAALAVVPSACGGSGDTGPVDAGPPDSGPPDAGPPPDSGRPPPLETLSYSPAGCGYEVSTPEVLEARMDDGVVGVAPTPRFVHLSFAGPTHGSFAASWRTELETTATRLLYGTDAEAVAAAEGADATTGVFEAIGHHLRYDPFGAEPVRQHEVHVCGLTAGTAYHYKVGGPGAWSQVFDVATAPEPGSASPWRFALTGDSRNDAVKWAEVQKAVLDSAADLQIFSGDAVVLGVSQPDWDAWFGESFMGTAVEDGLARIPFMPTNGNHEGLALNYLAQFALPQEVTPAERGGGEEWYSFDYANAHFAVLNDTTARSLLQGAQRDWLEADLAAVDRAVTPWVFVVHHKPPYSCSTRHGSEIELREVYQPLYDTYEVDLVLNGHDHVYERSKPIRGFAEGTTDGVVVEMAEDGGPAAGASGTIYLVTGGAGAPLYGVDTSCPHTHVTEAVNHYVLVDVEGGTLRLVAYRLDGSVLDEVTLTK